jgi:glyceraldehyde 3-phosphate dehydrogenase
MALRVGINGFGRIGRLILRGIIENKRKDIEVVGINDLGSIELNAHLLRYDSNHGIFPGEVSIDKDTIDVGSGPIKFMAERDPRNLGWKELGTDIVFESTGLFVDRDSAFKHIEAGADKVLLSAPGKDVDLTVVYGVNHDKLEAGHKIVSNASCTTNCLAPVADILNKSFGIEKGYMTTIHSYTSDQRPLDKNHPDPRRARACAINMIPATTGAAKALGQVLPELDGKLDGASVRVPTPNVSLIDLTFVSKQNTTIEEINETVREAANGYLKGILNYVTAELVSVDFNHNPASSNFDATQTQVVDGNFVRVLSWYDNEWGYSNRMPDTAIAMHNAV